MDELSRTSVAVSVPTAVASVIMTMTVVATVVVRVDLVGRARGWRGINLPRWLGDMVDSICYATIWASGCRMGVTLGNRGSVARIIGRIPGARTSESTNS